MDYFPHLNLGQIQLWTSSSIFVVCFIGILLGTRFWGKRKINKAVICIIAFVLAIPGCMILDVIVGTIIFSKLHMLNNKHMPTPAICLKYVPTFSALDAEYKVSPIVLKQWVQKYNLSEAPLNTFKSKIAPNSQGLTAIYDSQQETLTIHYHAF